MGDILLARRDREFPAETMLRDFAFEVRAEAVDRDKRTVKLSFSSEVSYPRWWGCEILDHGGESVRLGRLNGSAALLVNHDTDDQVGVVERAWLEAGRGWAIVRFGKSARANEVFEDVADGIRKLVSVGYRIWRMILESKDDDNETYRVIDWEPYEISIVSIPADTSVGIGREGDAPQFDPRTLIQQEDDDMNGTRSAGGAAAAPVVSPTVSDGQRGVDPSPVVATAPAAPVVQPQLDARQIQENERQRIGNIQAMGTRLNCAELASAAVLDGRSVDQFISDYQAQAGNASLIRTAESPEIGLSDRERQNFSFVRLLAAQADPTNTALREAAAFEYEASEAALSRGQAPAKPGCVRVPHDVLVNGRGMQRDQVVGTATAGGNLVATDLLSGSFVDMLVNLMSIMQLGATHLTGLNGNVAIPTATGGASVFWVAENETVTESQSTFGQIAMSPKTAGTFVDLSRKLLLQSSISVESFTRMEIARRIALGIDMAALNGSGTANQPRGIMNTAGIGAVTIGANGGAPNWENIIDLETAVAVENADIGATAYLTNARMRGKLKKTQKFAGTNGDPIWERDGTLNGYRALASNQVPSNLTKGTSTDCSAILFGNWADILIGMWGGLDMFPNPFILSGTGQVRIEAYQTVDVAVRRAASFAAITDARAA